jgi:hypothetical protein
MALARQPPGHPPDASAMGFRMAENMALGLPFDPMDMLTVMTVSLSIAVPGRARAVRPAAHAA